MATLVSGMKEVDVWSSSYGEELCKTCSQRKTTVCWGGLVLLAIDVFTIILILVLFHKIYPPQGQWQKWNKICVG
jgi:hypothetical protein